jgi:hypothetical protein
MHAIAHRAWAPLATILVAVGVHAVIVASLPKGRPHFVLSAPVAAMEPTAEARAVAPPVAAPIVPPAPAAQPAKTKPAALAPAAVRVARKKAASHDDHVTTETRPPVEDDAPVSFETPLPVTIVTPPSAPSNTRQ